MLLLLVAARSGAGWGWWTKTELPASMQKVDGVTDSKSRSDGCALVAGSPDPAPYHRRGASDAELGVSASAQAGALAVFVFLGTLAPGLPLALSLLMRERGTALLTELRSWMVRENAMIVAVLCLVFAAKLLGDALIGSGS